MNENYTVSWSDEALKNVNLITDYLRNHWSQKEADHFLQKLQERETLISEQPKAYPLSDKDSNYWRSVLTKQITIYYKIEDETIEIGSIFDTRQNPNELHLDD